METVTDLNINDSIIAEKNLPADKRSNGGEESKNLSCCSEKSISEESQIIVEEDKNSSDV